MSATVIYQSNNIPPHRCSEDFRFMDHYPIGSIARCDKCGAHWYLTNQTDGCAPPTYLWRRVYWWHFGKRRIIRGTD